MDLDLTIEDARELEVALRIHIGELRQTLASRGTTQDFRRIERLRSIRQRVLELLEPPASETPSPPMH